MGNWSITKRPPPLVADRIHVWRIGLETDEAAVLSMRSLLDDYELTRADRFKFDRHRRRFIVGRAALRRLLAMYLDSDASGIKFEYSGHGKPSLPTDGSAGLSFNVTNSHEMALVAVTTGRRVGVDVEHLRPMPDALKLAARFFTAAETDALRAAPVEALQATFFRTWTRKEAILKASGEGLSRPLNSFDVSPPHGPLLVDTPDGFDRPTTWRLGDLSPGHAYTAALAADGGGFEVDYLAMGIGALVQPPGGDIY